jgi:transcriptional regulator with XRE-family HTH domain
VLKIDNEKVALTRAEAIMTVRALSKASNVAASTISKIEKGHTEPNLVTIGKLAKALGVSVSSLVKNKD